MLNKLLIKYRSQSQQMKVVFWFTFVGFLQKGISIVTTPIFTRLLSTEDYGLFSVFNSYYMVLVIVATLNLHMGVINNAFVKSGQTQEKIVACFQSLALVVSGSFFVLAVLLRNELSRLMKLPVIVVVMIFVGFIFKEPYHEWVVYKRYQYEYKKPVLAAVVFSILTPLVSVLSILLTKGNQGIARVVSYVCMGTILPGSIFYVVNYRRGRCFYDKDLWKYAASFNIPLIWHYLAETLLNQTDRIMINEFLGKSDAAIYSVAFSAAALFTIFSSALNMAFVPWTFQKLKDKRYQDLGRVGYTVLLFLAVILAVLIMFAPEVVLVLAGKKYTGAVYLIPTLSASVFFGYMYQLFSRIELYFEKKSYTVISTVTAAVLNIILNYLWIPKYGYVAAGYSTLISHILFCVMHYFFYRKIVNAHMDGAQVYDLRILILISVGVLGISFVMTILYSYLYVRIAVLVGIFAVLLVSRKRLISLVKGLLAARR